VPAKEKKKNLTVKIKKGEFYFVIDFVYHFYNMLHEERVAEIFLSNQLSGY
jgi:hypothetical protein